MPYEQYLAFLEELLQELNQLTQVGKEKLMAVQNHELDTLNECIKQEQAISLTLRGLEQKRTKVLAAIGCENVPLSEMPRRCPENYRARTQELVDRLLTADQVLKSVQTPSRTIMERDLRAIRKELEARGVVQELEDNYQSAPPAPGKGLRTDFRA